MHFSGGVCKGVVKGSHVYGISCFEGRRVRSGIPTSLASIRDRLARIVDAKRAQRTQGMAVAAICTE